MLFLLFLRGTACLSDGLVHNGLQEFLLWVLFFLNERVPLIIADNTFPWKIASE